MRLVRLRATNFLAYADLDLDLDGVGQIAVVGSNGAGKSSLLDAVLWCIAGVARVRDGKSRASSDELIREGAGSSFVETTWADGAGREVVIARRRNARSSKSDLTLWVAGENKTRSTIADTQTAIEEVIGLPIRALLAGPIMAQGESDALMAADPSERKEILTKLFELDRFVEWYDVARADGNRAAARADIARQRVGALQEVVDEELSVRGIKRDAEQQLKKSRGRVAELDSAIVALREEATSLREEAARIDGYRRQQREWSAALTRSNTQLVDHDEMAKAMTKAQAGGAGQPYEEAFGRLEQLERMTVQYADATRRSAVVRTVPCGAAPEFAGCQFLVEAVAAVDVVTELGPRIAALGGPMSFDTIQHRKAEIRAAERRQAALDERRKNAIRWLAGARLAREDLVAAINTAKNQVAEATHALSRLEQDTVHAERVAADLGAMAEDLRMAQQEVEVALSSIGGAEERLKVIARAKEDLAAARVEERVAGEEEELNRQAARAFGRDGIPTLILEGGLPLIEDRANEILGRMPGGFAIALVTQKENKVGTIRETLDVVVSTAGRDRAYSLLSGGERLRVDFALRVALADVLVRRAGRTFDTLWVDEGFGTQDRLGREAMLEAIAAVAHDFALIVVVSHMEDVTDRFETRLLVIKDADGVATAEVVG